MRYFSMFSGIGGFELGIGSKHECIGYSEIDKYAIQIYQKHFPDHKNYGDATTINTHELPDFDLLVGGFPCQSFSIAGRRLGFNEARGTLFFEIARILTDKKPRYFILENVKGLLSHDQGETFSTILGILSNLGYEYQWQVLNSKNFGVPQNRERIFIIGNLREETRPKIFPLTKDGGLFDKKGKSNERQSQTEISGTIRSSIWKVKADDTFVIDKSYPSRERIYRKTVPTIRDFGSGGNKMPMVNGIRRLTPIECERLQGFPDNWTEGISDTQRYKCLGNAVTVNVVKYLMEKGVN